MESLRNLFFSSKGGHPVDARRRFLLKKRTRSEEKEKVKIKFSKEAAKFGQNLPVWRVRRFRQIKEKTI